MTETCKRELDAKTVEVATTVIIHAGNARALVNESLNEANNGDLEQAKESLIKAKNELILAHRVQTEVIQAEARGDAMELSMLFTHAQDTLIVANSEIQMAKHMLKMYDLIHRVR